MTDEDKIQESKELIDELFDALEAELKSLSTSEDKAGNNLKPGGITEKEDEK